MSGMHFEQMAGEYAAARPPYPYELYRALAEDGVTGCSRSARAPASTVELLRAVAPDATSFTADSRTPPCR